MSENESVPKKCFPMLVPQKSLLIPAKSHSIFRWFCKSTLHKSAEHKEKPANPDISRVYELLRFGAGDQPPITILGFYKPFSRHSNATVMQQLKFLITT